MTHVNRRGGFSLLAVLALMAIAGMMLSAWTRHALQEQQLTRGAHLRAQAEWLAHAARSRALAKLVADPGYSGETIAWSAEDLSQAHKAVARIVVSRDKETALIEVTVDLPPGNARVVRCSTTTRTTLTPNGESP